MPSHDETKAQRAEIIKKLGGSATNTGSAQVQIGLLTRRINQLTEHAKKAPKDFSCRRGLLQLVGQRKRLLVFLKREYGAEYLKVLQALDLRK